MFCFSVYFGSDFDFEDVDFEDFDFKLEFHLRGQSLHMITRFNFGSDFDFDFEF